MAARRKKETGNREAGGTYAFRLVRVAMLLVVGAASAPVARAARDEEPPASAPRFPPASFAPGGAAESGVAAGTDRTGLPPEGAPWPGICELPGVDRAHTPSRQCLACHGGTAGPAVAFEMPGTGNGTSHPVEVDYGEAARRNAGRYAPPSEIPPEVPLVDGRVACTTCHDGASREAKRVVDPMRLCLACHRL